MTKLKTVLLTGGTGYVGDVKLIETAYALTAPQKGVLATFALRQGVEWKPLCFLVSRYKVVANMLAGMNRVLEAGCTDPFGT